MLVPRLSTVRYLRRTIEVSAEPGRFNSPHLPTAVDAGALPPCPVILRSARCSIDGVRARCRRHDGRRSTAETKTRGTNHPSEAVGIGVVASKRGRPLRLALSLGLGGCRRTLRGDASRKEHVYIAKANISFPCLVPNGCDDGWGFSFSRSGSRRSPPGPVVQISSGSPAHRPRFTACTKAAEVNQIARWPAGSGSSRTATAHCWRRTRSAPGASRPAALCVRATRRGSTSNGRATRL